jgi:hypothetical protein
MLVSRETGCDRRGRVRNAEEEDSEADSEADVSVLERWLSKCREPETETRAGSKGCKAVAATASDEEVLGPMGKFWRSGAAGLTVVGFIL